MLRVFNTQVRVVLYLFATLILVLSHSRASGQPPTQSSAQVTGELLSEQVHKGESAPKASDVVDKAANANSLRKLQLQLVAQAQDEKRAAEAIAKARGTIEYERRTQPSSADQDVSLDGSSAKPSPTGDHDHAIASIVAVRLNGYGNRSSANRFSVVGPHLVKLSSLRKITLWGGVLEARDFEILGQMKLEELFVRQEDVLSPQNAAAIARNQNLRNLRFDNAKVSPAALREFAKLPQLEELHISCSSMDRSTGKYLTQFQVNDEAAREIGRFANLRKLMLFSTRISDEGMASLSKLSRLEYLVVGSHEITGASLDHVAKLQRLETLGTWAWKLQDSDLHKLTALPKLTSLDLLTHLSDSSVPHLQKLSGLTFLRLRGDGITDACLPKLYRHDLLERLDLSSTSIDKKGRPARALQMHLPDCKIMLPRTAEEKAMKEAFNKMKFGRAVAIPLTEEQIKAMKNKPVLNKAK